MTTLLQNIEAERAVIAGLIRDPNPQTLIKLVISDDLFTLPAIQEAFRAILSYVLNGIPPDAATLRAVLKDAAMIEVETSLAQEKSAANLPVYVQILKECRRNRAVKDARQRLAGAAATGAPEHELAAILESIRQATQDDEAKKPSRFTPIKGLCALPPTENWLIKRYITNDSLNALFGDPGCGKSFVAIDIACHVATGKPWRGNAVKAGSVLYIAGEGKNGLAKRFKAWFERHGEEPRNIQLSTTPIRLVDANDIASLIAEIREMPEQLALIVIDTLNRNFGPGDENSTADMTKAVAGLDAIRNATGAAILAIHHTGHGDKSRARGSIVLNASLDMEFSVRKSDRYVELTNTKPKDHEPPPPLAWTLEKQFLPWLEEDGTPIDSAVLASTETSTKASTRQMLTRPQRITLDALDTAIERHGDGESALVADWRRVAIDAGITQSESRQGKHAAFMRAVDTLVDANLVIQDGHRYSPAKASTRQQTSTKRQHVDNVDTGTEASTPSTLSTHPYRGVDMLTLTPRPTSGGFQQPVDNFQGGDITPRVDGLLSQHADSKQPVDEGRI